MITTILMCASLFAVDGDTIKCRETGELMRLLGSGVPFVSGIDTPEIGSHAKCLKERKLALLAKGRLKELLKPGVRIEWGGAVDKTQRHRKLVNLYDPQGREIGALLLSEGFAREWRAGEKVDWCNE